MSSRDEEVANRFLEQEFKRYYEESFLEDFVPKPLESHEWAFFYIGRGGSMQRHMSFPDFNELKGHITSNVPLHVYASSALYECPDAPTMEGKGWQGAELVFDLDADHVPGAEQMDYGTMLENIKSQFIDLVEDFLMGDFGFSKKDILLAFSGSRGYHAHVTTEEVLELSSQMRKEIVDYVMGTGLDEEMLLHIQTDKISRFGKSIKYGFYLPERSDGWKARSTNRILRFAGEIKGMDREEGIKEIRRIEGIGEGRAAKVLDTMLGLVSPGINQAHSLSNLESALGGKKRITAFINFVKERYEVCLDAPVTGDVNRLMRCPGSLHGKSGLVTKPIGWGELGDFEPLVRAIPDVFKKGREVKLRAAGTKDFELGGQGFHLEKGETIHLPEYAAVFATARKIGYPVPVQDE